MGEMAPITYRIVHDIQLTLRRKYPDAKKYKFINKQLNLLWKKTFFSFHLSTGCLKLKFWLSKIEIHSSKRFNNQFVN